MSAFLDEIFAAILFINEKIYFYHLVVYKNG